MYCPLYHFQVKYLGNLCVSKLRRTENIIKKMRNNYDILKSVTFQLLCRQLLHFFLFHFCFIASALTYINHYPFSQKCLGLPEDFPDGTV